MYVALYLALATGATYEWIAASYLSYLVKDIFNFSLSNEVSEIFCTCNEFVIVNMICL